jgi:hypothetical protein
VVMLVLFDNFLELRQALELVWFETDGATYSFEHGLLHLCVLLDAL